MLQVIDIWRPYPPSLLILSWEVCAQQRRLVGWAIGGWAHCNNRNGVNGTVSNTWKPYFFFRSICSIPVITMSPSFYSSSHLLWWTGVWQRAAWLRSFMNRTNGYWLHWSPSQSVTVLCCCFVIPQWPQSSQGYCLCLNCVSLRTLLTTLDVSNCSALFWLKFN
jgi:hypothetical protein